MNLVIYIAAHLLACDCQCHVKWNGFIIIPVTSFINSYLRRSSSPGARHKMRHQARRRMSFGNRQCSIHFAGCSHELFPGAMIYWDSV